MNVLSSDSASEKFGNNTIAEIPIIAEINTNIRVEREVFNMLKKQNSLFKVNMS